MPVLPISESADLATIAKTHTPDKPVFMLNLWRFYNIAQYGPEYAHLAGEECTGEEAIERVGLLDFSRNPPSSIQQTHLHRQYRTAIQSVLPANASVHLTSKVLAGVVAPASEKWDYMAVVRYESFEGFRKMVESEVYKRDVEGHRLAALREFRLVMLEGDGVQSGIID
jgi:hypothetical protein